MISDEATQFHALLQAMSAEEQPDRPIEEVRAASALWAVATGEPEGVTYRPVDADGVAAEWVVPVGADAGRVLLYLHGGGYSVGSIESHRKLVGHLARAAGLRGLIIDYRLAPEHPFPAGLDDAVTAFSWLLREGHEATHIGVGGDSAGGGLALATALALRQRGLPAPGGLVLLSPWTDLASTGASLTTNTGKDLILGRGDEEDPGIAWYAGEHDVKNPLISPLYADFGDFPPFIVHVHGGPTANSVPVLSLEKAFFTSRGIGVIDVNYGGSTGYGRAYRERLRGEWGVVDVADAMHAALALAESGDADRARLGIRGGSAGGWTALAAVTSGLRDAPEAVFSAATSYFGVSDLRPFVTDTHDFESRYLDGLIGPLPAADALYEERAPVGHVTPLTCPVLLLQGLDDPIVPPSQSEAIARDLAAHGIPYAYIAFEGESHGFRKAETNIASLEAELAFYGQVFGFTPPGVAPIKLS